MIPASIVKADYLKKYYCAETQRGGEWMLSRPLPQYSILTHVRACWLVFTGKADALVWGGGQ